MLIHFSADQKDPVGTPEEELSRFHEDIGSHQTEWTQSLSDNPDEHAEIEAGINQTFQHGGGRYLAALMQQMTEEPDQQWETAECCKAFSPKPRQRRSTQITLLCGLVIWVTSWYCPPADDKNKFKSKVKQLGGMFPELAAFGIGKGCSAALQYTVARIVALNPSIHVAHKELKRQGIHLDKKAVRRIAEQLGKQLLTLRQRELLAWRAGNLEPTHEFAGQRVSVQIDGGRTRIRENKKPPKTRKKGERQKFKAPWREPKLLTIFAFDEHGKKTDKHCQPLIDGTFLGPDHLAELTAFHLHRLGVGQAEVVVFASDGAPWIWDRIEWIIRRVGLDRSKVVEVLDFCHASHHISMALKHLGWKGKERKQHHRELRGWLREGKHDAVVEELRRQANEQSLKDDHKVWTEIRYLEKHGEANRLDYAKYRDRGLPLGSGAIESPIRRVVNQRLKSNAMYWLAENAEAMLSVRALLLTDRWDETLKRVRATMAQDRSLDWQWEACEMSKEPNSLTDVKPPSSQAECGEPVMSNSA